MLCGKTDFNIAVADVEDGEGDSDADDDCGDGEGAVELVGEDGGGVDLLHGVDHHRYD